MKSRNGWRRVSRALPCPVCQKRDWCLLSADGNAVICARTESPKRCGEAGWLHRLRDNPWQPARRVVRSVSVAPVSLQRDMGPLAAEYRGAINYDRLQTLSRSLGLSASSLSALGIGWSAHHHGWTFPMVDPDRNILGIRLRLPDGRKLAVKGSREGLFVPASSVTDARLLVAEGPTDTAALLDMGFGGVVGRPSCTGGAKLLITLVRRHRLPEVVIVADADEPGRCGANNLASVLVAYVPSVRIITPPAGLHDARDWLRAGGARHDVEEAIGAAVVRRLVIRGGCIRTERGRTR